MTFCPGKVQPTAMTGGWSRDLEADLAAIADAGADTLVTLVEAQELTDLRVPDLGARAGAAGLAWWHLPIVDQGVPDPAWEARWCDRDGPALHARLDAGALVVVHCKGGLGRTGLVAARLLVDRGVPPEEAIAAVRAARRRPDAKRLTIENAAQESWVRALARRR